MAQTKKLSNIFYLTLGILAGLTGGFILLFIFNYLSSNNIFLGEINQIISTIVWLFFSGGLGFAIAYAAIFKKSFKEVYLASQKLQEVSNSKTEFVFFIAHQLRAPLSAVRLSFLMFQDGDLGKTTAKQKKIIEADLKEIDGLLGTIEGLMDIPKIEQRQLSFDKRIISLGKFLAQVENSLKHFFSLTKQKDISFDYSIPPSQEGIFLEIDWPKIKQVLDNLFDNALHYTRNNGQISLGISIEKNFLIIALSDTGIGIPKEEQANIFEKFYRASNAKAFSSKGTGIGLYLAKFMVESHGGKVWFDSQEGHGTTFYFSLPLRANVEEFLKNI